MAATISAQYTEHNPQPGEVKLLLKINGKTKMKYSRPALAQSVDEVNASVDEMKDFAISKGHTPRVLSSVDNLRADITKGCTHDHGDN